MYNLLKPDTSEWWTKNDSAWIIMDMHVPTIISDITLQWWGISYADQVKISVSNDKSFWALKRTEGDLADPIPIGEYNQFSSWQGFEGSWRYLRFEFSHGHPDPWNKGEHIGLRHIEIHGRASWEFCSNENEFCDCTGRVMVMHANEFHNAQFHKGNTICQRQPGMFGNEPMACYCERGAHWEEAESTCSTVCNSMGPQCNAFGYFNNQDPLHAGSHCCFYSELGTLSTSFDPEENAICYEKA